MKNNQIIVTLDDLKEIEGLHVMELNEIDEYLTPDRIPEQLRKFQLECTQRIVDKLEADFIKFIEKSNRSK